MPVLRKHQTLFDFTAQHCGGMDAVFIMAQQNGIGITDTVAAGTSLEVMVTDKKVVADFLRNGLVIATAYNLPVIPTGGIGFMRIKPDPLQQEVNWNNGFIVS